ncbi:MAG: LTA synthase family protein [Clostridium sp.]|nr:LTA synthase family protein [Clostridium sp.]
MKIQLESVKSHMFSKENIKTNIVEMLYFIFFIISGVYKCVYLQFQNRINFRPFFSKINMYMTVSTICFVLLVIAFMLVFYTRNKIMFLIFNVFLSTLLFADALYLRYYNTIITVPVIYNARYLGPVKESVLSLIRKSDILYFFDIPFFIILSILYRKKFKEIKLPFLKRCVAAVLLILVSFAGFKVAYSNNDTSEYDNNYIVKNLGIGYFHYYDIRRYIKQNWNRNKNLSNDEINEIVTFFEGKDEETGKLSKKYSGIAKGKNLIVIQMEALQEFVIGREINGKEITPNLNKLIGESLYFSNIYVQVAGGNTSDAELMTNTSLYPAKEGAAYFRFATNEYNTLSKELKKEGYNSYALHAYGAAFWNRTEMYKAIGFDQFISSSDFVLDEYIGWGGWALSDDSFYRQSMDKIDVQKPFYAFYVTLSGHHPYSYFDDKQTFDVGKYDRTYLGNYIKAQNYADAAVGRFMERLKDMGVYENSLIVIYGDHAGLPKAQSKELLEFLGKTDDNVDWIKLQKIPLIIHCPGINAEAIEKTGGQIDIFPMITNMMGLKNDYAMGKDIINSEKGYAVLRNGSVLTDDYYYSSEADTVYDLKNGSILDKAIYLDQIEKYRNELKISDLIIEKDALRKLR